MINGHTILTPIHPTFLLCPVTLEISAVSSCNGKHKATHITYKISNWTVPFYCINFSIISSIILQSCIIRCSEIDLGRLILCKSKFVERRCVCMMLINVATAAFVIFLILHVIQAGWEEEYDAGLQKFLQMAARQREMFIGVQKIDPGWMNPSFVPDPHNDSRLVMTWRIPDRAKKDKIGYCWLEYPSMQVIKPKDMIGEWC